MVSSEVTALEGRIAAVVVTHHPDVRHLAQLCSELARSVASIVVVDNGSGDAIPWSDILPNSACLVGLPRNLGIAAAQNRGIARARDQGASHVLFLDQDSTIDVATIRRLAAAHLQAGATGLPVAAVGPVPHDPRLSRPARRRVPGLAEVDHLISSGSLVSLQSLDQVGPLREDLFIDYVDIEWCLRARSLGLRCYQVGDAVLQHEFGTPARILRLRISMRTPARHYYYVRNSIWLWRQHWVPMAWKFGRAPALLARLVIYVLFARPHRTHWKMIALGLIHGLAGRSGALPQ